MTKREDLNLVFSWIKTNQGSHPSCTSSTQTGPSLDYAIVLSGYDITYTEHLILNMTLAEQEMPFEVSHLTDSLLDDFEIRIVPPYVEITDSKYKFPIIVWKSLMQEWLEFLKLRNS